MLSAIVIETHRPLIEYFVQEKLMEDTLTGFLMGCLFVAACTVMYEFWGLTLNGLYKYRMGDFEQIPFHEKLCVGIEVVAFGTALFVGTQLVESFVDKRHLSDFTTSWWAFWFISFAMSSMVVGYWLHAQAAIQTIGRSRPFIVRTCIQILLGGLGVVVLALLSGGS